MKASLVALAATLGLLGCVTSIDSTERRMELTIERIEFGKCDAKLVCGSGQCDIDVRCGRRIVRIGNEQLEVLGRVKVGGLMVFSALGAFDIDFFSLTLEEDCPGGVEGTCLLDFAVRAGEISDVDHLFYLPP